MSNPPAVATDRARKGRANESVLVEGIGQKLRQRRKLRQLSMREVASKAGVSIALLSLIERGISPPSLRALNQICAALEMPLRWLFEAGEIDDTGADDVIVRLGNRRKLDFGASGLSKEILTPDVVTDLQLMRFVIHCGGISGESPNPHPTGAKAGTVISGQLGLEVDGKHHVLKTGDSFAFRANARYRFWCVGQVDCELFWVATPALY